MRPVLALGLVIAAVVICAAGLLAQHVWGWRTAVFDPPPTLAQDIPGLAGQMQPIWTERLRETFPIGSTVTDMTARLEGEGFMVDAEERFAAYGWAVSPCVYTLTIRWRADDEDRIRSIQGGLLNACTDPSRLLPERFPYRRRRNLDDSPPSLVEPAQSA